MTVSRWASVPAEMIAGFHSAGVTDQYDTGGNLCSSDIVRRTYELRLGGTRALPLLVKVQLVCKAWYKGAGRGITNLSLRSFHETPVSVFQTFTALNALRLDLQYVPWSDLQKIGHLVHLQHLHLSEWYRCEAVNPQDRAFARKASGRGSPFSCLTGLRSLKLELHKSRAADPDCDGTRYFLQPISCMNNLQGFTLLGLCTSVGIHHLSQLSQLTSLGVGHVEDGLSMLVNLKHLQAAAMILRCLTLRRIGNLSASLVTLTNLRSLDCTQVHYCQVSNLKLLTALKALTIGLMHVHGMPFNQQPCMAIWSDLAGLTHLNTLSVHSDALLDAKDFQAVALLSCLTKLHFEGFTLDLDFKSEDVNKLSALASLQYFHLQFIHSGRWCDAVVELDIHLRALLKGANMQHFQVISNKCGCVEDYLGGFHLQSGDDDSSLGEWGSDSDVGSDNDSDMYSQHSDE